MIKLWGVDLLLNVWFQNSYIACVKVKHDALIAKIYCYSNKFNIHSKKKPSIQHQMQANKTSVECERKGDRIMQGLGT